MDLADHDPDRRAALVAADGLERALVAPSIPLGVETLPEGEAEPLLAAYHEGVAALPAPFGAWAAVGLAAPDPAALSRLLDDGFAGACVAADALAGPAGYERLGPVLETLERRDAPLLIHPGPVAAPAPDGAPLWWAALTDYVTVDADGVVRLRGLGTARPPRSCACASPCSPGWRRCTASG